MHSPEPLESRIAPAMFFVSAAASGPFSLKIVDASGQVAQSVAATLAQQATGATAVVQLQAGDELIFDANSNHRFDRGDRPLAEVAAGQGLFFFTDGPTGVLKHAFELTELTGIAISDGFAASVHTDINGTVATALDSAGQLTVSNGKLSIQHTSLARLAVGGQVIGHVLAGEDLTGLTVGGKHYNQLTPQVSVSGRVGAGTGVVGIINVSFNAGPTRFFTGFTPAPGEDGGDIDHVSLKFGVGPRGIVAGDGDSPLGGAGGRGGSIIAVTVTNSPNSLHVFAGNGGASTIGGDAGAGGSIRDSAFSLAAPASAEVKLYAGAGGNSTRNAGGTGGDIANVKLSTANSLDLLQVVAGHAGRASTAGQLQGNGGNLSDLQIFAKSLTDTHPNSSPALVIRAGDGASQGADGSESTGGSITHLRLSAGDATGSTTATVRAGNGGPSGDRFHGTGGAILDSTIALHGRFTSFDIFGGAGGGQNLAGAGGGRIDHLRFVNAVDQGGVNIFGGDTIEAPAGDVTDLTATNAAGRLDFLSIRGGDALTDGATIDPAGLLTGGAVTDLSLINHGTSIRSLAVIGGIGTVGGGLSNLQIENTGRLPVATLVAGAGRFGGGVDHVTIQDTGGIGALTHPLRINAGHSLSFPTSAPVADISDIQINAPLGYVAIGGEAVAAPGGAVGGAGGNVTHIFGTAKWLDLRASDGGVSGGGTGGAGGNISDVRFTVTGGFVYRMAAGNGGAGSVGGAGGNVSDVIINGDIGDFQNAFGFDAAFGQMGGLSAGKAGRSFSNTLGSAGSVSNITAYRIAAIVAGSPDADHPLTAANAVATIADLSTVVLGADTGVRGEHREIINRRHNFDFDGGGDDLFTLGQDTPVDGLVVVKAGGLLTPLPVPPLKLIVV